MGMLKSALWCLLSLIFAAGVGCGIDSTPSVEPVNGRAETEAGFTSPSEQVIAEEVAASYVQLEPSMTVLPASVTWPIPSLEDVSTEAADDDGPIAKTIYIDITWDENYKYIFDFEEPLTVPAGKKVRFIVTNTFTNPDECW